MAKITLTVAIAASVVLFGTPPILHLAILTSFQYPHPKKILTIRIA